MTDEAESIQIEGEVARLLRPAGDGRVGVDREVRLADLAARVGVDREPKPEHVHADRRGYLDSLHL